MTHTRLGRVAAWTVGHTGPLILLLGAAMLVAHLAAATLFPKANGRIVFGDATHHFVQLRSMVFDRDLNFRNEYVRIYGLVGGEPGTEWIFSELTATGHVRNYMPVGPALLWAPLYVLVAAATWLLSLVGLSSAPDGFSRALQMVPGVTGILAVTASTWLSWKLARRFTDAGSAAIGAIGVWIGSHALYYSLVSPSYSHAASMLTSAIFFSYWLASRERPSVGRAAAWGALAGASALMRWQDGLFLAIPVIEIARWRAQLRTRVVAALAVGASWLAAFSPQMVVWNTLYGQPFALPQGPAFLQWTTPHPIAVLLSDNHGLLTWAPILVLSLIGIAGFIRRQPGLGTPLVVVLVASWYINAAVADWWAGEAFGARRFLSLFPLFVVGLAMWTQAIGRPAAARTPRLAVIGALTVANLLLLLQYECFMKGLVALAPYPSGWFDMWIVRFIVPFRLLTWWQP